MQLFRLELKSESMKMRKLIIGIWITIALLACIPSLNVNAEGSAGSGNGSNSSLPLCLPGIYLIPPADCLPLGPSQPLTSLAKVGYNLPPHPPVGSSPTADLGTIPYQYIKVTADKAKIPLYTSPPKKRDDPAPVYQDPGFKYFSYLNSVETEDGFYYYTKGGYYVDGRCRQGCRSFFPGSRD